MNCTRREFCRGTLIGSAAFTGWGFATGQGLFAVEGSSSDLARRQAAHRRRRIIYNNDGDDIFAVGANTRESFLAQRHVPLLNTQVDSIYYCTTQSFNHFTHQTKVAEMLLSYGGPLKANNLQEFLGQNTDGLRMSSEFARAHGLESIWTLRMNDIHDFQNPVFLSRWKQEDPSRVMSRLADVEQFNDRRRIWTLVDFEHPDVEPRLLAIIEEVLRGYMLDGIELDFMRAPFYFRTAYDGKPATRSQLERMSRLVQKIRELVLAESQRQGRPLLLGCRVPSTEAYCLYLGIDIRSWLQEHWVDTMTLSGGYVAFDMVVEELIALGHQHDVPVYGCLSQSGLCYRPPRGNGEPQPAAAWRGAAARFFQAGADGIYTFNLFSSAGLSVSSEMIRDILNSIGSPPTIAAKERLFAVGDAGAYMPNNYWAKDVEDFSKSLPIAIHHSKVTEVPLIVVEPLSLAKLDTKLTLRLDFTGVSDGTVPQIRWNGARLETPSTIETVSAARRMHFAIPAATTRPGQNNLQFEPLPGGVQLFGAELWLTSVG